MILQSEIRKIAEKEGVPTDTIDKSWVLGHFLAELFRLDWAQQYLVFKGGTCLKKCYFKDYRFSEDLDFTLIDSKIIITKNLLQSVFDSITSNVGILFSPIKINLLKSNNQAVGYETRVGFWGANHKRNQPPTPFNKWTTSIKIEIIFYEKLVDAPECRSIYHNFTDNLSLAGVKIPCYSISEIIAEKFRALLQRSYSAPRDYYDLWKMLQLKEEIDWNKIVRIFKQKMEYKGILWNGYEEFFHPTRINSMKLAWKNSLKNHLNDNELPDIETVLSELKLTCEKIVWF
jgi:predicted nucleotidyltransferase component of viral defense system